LPDRLFAGRYRAEAQLGKGGFGVVLRARDENTGRRVALKLLRGTNLDAATRSRFEREARVVQHLTHPNTVRLFDFGADADGTPFIVYELLDGETLAEIIKRGPISLERTVHIGAQVLKALCEAHALGIVHRDIKPANVMVLQFAGDRDVVKVLDFGIAKPTLAATQVLTTTGAVVGTPRFMSPEQVNGSPVGPSSDVYSMGLLLSEMLSGVKVFEGSPYDIMMAQMSAERVPLPPFVAASPLSRVIARAVEKDPARRFPSAAEMLDALRGTDSVALPPVSNAPLPLPAPAPATPPSRRDALPLILIIVFGVLTLAVLTGTAGIAWYLHGGTSAAPVAGTAESEPPAAGGLLSPPTDAKLPTFDVDATAEILKKNGWLEVTRDIGAQEGTIMFHKGERNVSIEYSIYANPRVAIENGQQGPGPLALARFGSTVVELVVLGKAPDADASKKLRDQLLKLLQARHASPSAPLDVELRF